MAGIIIGRAQEEDPSALKLFTGLNRFIANERPDSDLAPEVLRNARKQVEHISPSARCRSLTAMYNCVGMVFASRRTVVDVDHVLMVLRDDGYRVVPESEAFIGDVVLYRKGGEPRHVGIIYEFRDVSPLRDGSIWEKFVLSQWGESGEYLHKLREVHPMHGKELEFWSERRLL